MAQEPADSIATDSVTTDKHDPAEYLSGSLPVLYINTDGEKEIVSKEVYLKGTYYLDAMGIEGYENIGSAETPLALQIKGRGNTTWKFDKKPYRLKFDKKAAPLGMNKSKHFVLLANCEHNSLSLYKDVLGFWLSRQLGLKWTPAIKPVELVINGDYRGLYNLAEQVRVDPDRVNVVEQEDGETDPDLVTGGWLVEIDNYTEVGQVLIQSKKDGRHIRFTPKTPEE
ncbi:MAG: CotH kinase family protein, partial [Muribaculaceae bacterium]|nr:CotH kinase family protein [Muribaculaceae bacterium]